MQFLMTKDGYVGMQFLMTMDECVEAEAGSRKQEVAGHTTTRVRKQRVGSAHSLFFIWFRSQAHRMVLLTFRVGLAPQLT